MYKTDGSLGISIIGGSDYSCHPFGGNEPGIFISKVFILTNFRIFIFNRNILRLCKEVKLQGQAKLELETDY